MTDKIKAHHLERKTILYVRQSSNLSSERQPREPKAAICNAAAAAALTYFAVLFAAASVFAQEPGFPTREMVIKYTPDWKGERFADGRPKVPDDILKRMKSVTLEEAWAQLRSAGFNHEYEDGWYSIHPDNVLVGRALTAQWVPGRPDIQKVIEHQGKQDGRVGAENAWRSICCSRETSTCATTSV